MYSGYNTVNKAHPVPFLFEKIIVSFTQNHNLDTVASLKADLHGMTFANDCHMRFL